MLACQVQRKLAAALCGLLWCAVTSHQRVQAQEITDDSATVVVFESRGYGDRGWAPEQVVGEPNTPEAGDRTTAWASASPDGSDEWLICQYDRAVSPTAIRVHETYNPGALVKVTAFDGDDEVVLWEGEDPTPRDQPKGVSVIPVRAAFAVQRIKLYLDSDAVPGWNEIDAVGLVDSAGMQWAVQVAASSTYAERSEPQLALARVEPYSAEQAAGPPGSDRGGNSVWRSMGADDQEEWLICEYETATKPAQIVIHEATATGAVTKITAFDENDDEHLAWEGDDPTPRNRTSGVSVFPVDLLFAVKKIKIHVDSPAVSGFNDIDAVGLRDTENHTVWAKTAEASSSFASRFQSTVPISSSELRRMQSELRELKKTVAELQKIKADFEQLKASLNDAVEAKTPRE